MEYRGIRISRTRATEIGCYNPPSIGASYTWVKSIKDNVGPDTSRIVMQHAQLRTLEGLEKSKEIVHAYLGFNLIKEFRPEDSRLRNIDVLDLAGNPIKSLKNCPPCRELIVSSTLVENAVGCPDTVEILRIGHSTHLKSIKGIRQGLKILEINEAPNLVFDELLLPSSIEEVHRNGEVTLYK